MRYGDRAKNSVFERDHVTNVMLAHHRYAIEQASKNNKYSIIIKYCARGEWYYQITALRSNVDDNRSMRSRNLHI